VSSPEASGAVYMPAVLFIHLNLTQILSFGFRLEFAGRHHPPAPDQMSILQLSQCLGHVAANRQGYWTARCKIAARRKIYRAGDLSLQGIHHLGIDSPMRRVWEQDGR
jgi:hypothetical protein